MASASRKKVWMTLGGVLWWAVWGAGSVQARWATPDDAVWELVFHNVEIDIDSDGTYTETIEIKRRILKESARAGLAIARETYNSNISRFKVLEAKTINDGKEIPVDSDFIEDRPLASSPNGFDKLNQVIIAFPEVRTGSELYFKFRRKNKESALQDFFAADFVFGWDGIFQSGGKIQLTSRLPLNLEKNDPDNALEIHQQVDGKKTEIEITLKKPVFKKAVDEANAHVGHQNLPWVTVASAKSWVDVSDRMISKYEEVLKQPLPPPFEKIFNEAKGKETTVEKLNAVTAGVDSLINYMGDWKTVSGRYVPRALATIAESRLGDCKDFSASTVAILRKLGFQAHVALVKRGVGALRKPTLLPSFHDFNHAMVYTEVEGRGYWIDPTNFVSFAQGIFSDIMDRPAWVLNEKNPFLGQIPLPTAEADRIAYTVQVDPEKNNLSHFDARLELGGSAAIQMTGARLKASAKSIDYNLVTYFGDRDQVMNWEVEPYDLTSRIVNDLDFRFKYSEKNTERKTTVGSAFDLSGGGRIVGAFMTKVEDRVSDLFVGAPMIARRHLVLRSAKRLGSQKLGCKIESPWLKASRKVADTRQGIEVTEDLQVLKSLIPSEELQTETFVHFQEQLSHCFKRVSVVFRRKPESEAKARKLARLETSKEKRALR